MRASLQHNGAPQQLRDSALAINESHHSHTNQVQACNMMNDVLSSIMQADLEHYLINYLLHRHIALSHETLMPIAYLCTLGTIASGCFINTNISQYRQWYLVPHVHTLYTCQCREPESRLTPKHFTHLSLDNQCEHCQFRRCVPMCLLVLKSHKYSFPCYYRFIDPKATYKYTNS